MNKNKTDLFIHDLKILLDKHDVQIDAYDNYGGDDSYCGQSVNIKSNQFNDDSLDIFIESINSLVEMIAESNTPISSQPPDQNSPDQPAIQPQIMEV